MPIQPAAEFFIALIAEEVITPAVRSRIESAIRQAEAGTSAEVRVHIEDHCNDDVLDRAAYVFAELGMHKTVLRNGVLIYVAVEQRKLAIIGDSGINNKVEKNFWQTVLDSMLAHFRNERVEAGIVDGVRIVGEKIRILFPATNNDRNELPDTVTTRFNP